MGVALLVTEFMSKIQNDLEVAQSEKGASWNSLPKAGDPFAVKGAVDRMFNAYMNQGIPISWDIIAGYAMIAWLIQCHPEFFANHPLFQAHQAGLAEIVPTELLVAS